MIVKQEIPNGYQSIAHMPLPHGGSNIQQPEQNYYVTLNTETVKDFNDIIKEVRKQQKTEEKLYDHKR